MGHGYRPLISKIRCENPYKVGVKIKNRNYLRYIATREGVDLSKPLSMENVINQNIEVNDNGEEDIFNQAGNSDYLKYITHRPRSHGLFGNIDTEKFENVSAALNKVSEDNKIIFRGVVSLSELDAQALGYTNAAKWEMYLKSVMPDIAKTLGLSPNNITWVGAFHAEQKHPHVHYMLWDNRDIVKSPYIHKTQQIACREICQNAMFTDENESIIRELVSKERGEYYSRQNLSRENITSYMKDIFSAKDYVPGVDVEKLPGRMREETHQELNGLYRKVLATMPGQGRVAYKFMPMECKAYIDRISDIFLKEPDIKDEYSNYLSAVKDIHKSMGETTQEISHAQDYAIKELQARTGNIILKGICNIKNEILEEQTDKLVDVSGVYSEVGQSGENLEVPFEEEADIYIPNIIQEMHSINMSEESAVGGVGIIDIEPESDSISEYSIYKMSGQEKTFVKDIRGMLDKKAKVYNPIEAEQGLLNKLESSSPALKNFIYKTLGKMYTDNQSIMENYEKAAACLNMLDAEQQDYQVHALLGKVYGEKSFAGYDAEKAEKHYMKAIPDKKYQYLKLKLSRMYADRSSTLCDYNKALDILNGYGDKKGSVALQKGNICADENSPYYNMEDAIECYREAADKGNVYAAYQLGKIFTSEYGEYLKTEEGVRYLEMAAEGDVLPAKLNLAKIYMKTSSEYCDISKAIDTFSQVLEDFDKVEQQPYSKLSRWDIQSKANTYYYLGKLYAGDNLEQDYSLAWESLELCLDTYAKIGENNNIFINNTYVQMAQICCDAREEYYNPEAGEEYLLRALENTMELQNQQEPEDSYIIHARQNIKLKLFQLYTNETAELWNLDKAMSMVEAEDDEKGTFAFKRGNIYANENYSKYDMNKALASYEEAAESGNINAMVKLGKWYLDKESIHYDISKAQEYFTKAMECYQLKENSVCELSRWDMQGRARVHYYLGKLYADENEKHNATKAYEHLKLCIKTYEECGEPNNIIVNSAYSKIAEIYMEPEDIYYNPTIAQAYLMRAYTNTLELCAMSETESQDNKIIRQSIQYKLSKLYTNEEMGLLNLNKAMTMVAYEDDDKGFFAMKRGDIFANEKYSDYNMNEAIKAYKVAAEQLNTTAMVKLGKCYLYGLGVDKNKEEALYWVKRAAALNDEYADKFLKNMESVKFNGLTYSILRQLLYVSSQERSRSAQQLQEIQFKSRSRQEKKEEYLHRN